VLGGKPFGEVGPYERITGRVYFALPVANLHNRGIVDLDRAVNLKNGEVEFSSEFCIVRPKEMKRGNGALLLEVPNRGHSRIFSQIDGGNWDLRESAGDAWLLLHGYTVAALGWQWDAVGKDVLHLYAPIAKDHGETITGVLRGDFMLAKAREDVPLGHFIVGHIGGSEYPVADPKDVRNVLTVRDTPLAPRIVIPRSQWQFAHRVNGKLEASDRHLYLDGGFQAGKIYEYIYVVANPVVAGLGFAAVRDFASYVKHDPAAVAPATRVYGEGISQTGRFLRDFLYQDFNADEDGNQALDGVLAHVAGAGRGSFNYRFAQPSRDAQPASSIFFPTDIFPFTDEPEVDPVDGARGGLLDRAAASKTVPKIFLSDTSYEYWGRAASLIHTSADGNHDVRVSDNVRIYTFAGLQHLPGPFPPAQGIGDLKGQNPQSPLPNKYFLRAMIANLDQWVRSRTSPPPSRYPKIAAGTLVPLAQYAFPAIPGVKLPHDVHQAWHLDFGPNWQAGILQLQPPLVGLAFPALVPQVDSDGNERDSIRPPEVSVPLATYTGWNLRADAIGASNQRVSFEGSYLPFPRTAEERRKTEDPRPSIAERYHGRQDYLHQYRRAVDHLIRKRYLLKEDRRALLQLGEQEWDFATN
jgi:hypothetical protein